MTAFAANPTEFVYDLSGRNVVRETATRTKGALSQWFSRFVARRQATAMAQIAVYNPQLAQEIWTAQAKIDSTQK